MEIDGRKYEVGGLAGQVEYGYLLEEWVDSLTSNPEAFQFRSFKAGRTKERFAWRRKRYSTDAAWPPPGASLTLDFAPPPGKLSGLKLAVHYEMYEGIPLLCKWFTIQNEAEKAVRLNTFVSEILAVVEHESLVNVPGRWEYPNMHVESDYEFGGDDPKTADKTTYWAADPQYGTQINYVRQSPVMLESRPPIGPDVVIEPGGRFESFRTFELIHDGTERERKGLAVRRMYRTIAPWATENPILMHVNPRLKEKALAMVYNPLDRNVEKELTLHLYYTGLTKTAHIREREGKARKYDLDRRYNVTIPVSIKPSSVTWFVVE